MTNNELNFDNYSKAYIDFVSKDIMSFVDEFILLTNNIDKNIRYYFVGNGASAAIASHLSNDFSKTLGVKATTFHDPALITCLSNDFGYENWLSEGVKIFGEDNDCLVLISSSGNSENIIEAAKQAKKQGMITVSLTGPRPSEKLMQNSDINISVKSEVYNIIECCHMIALCAIVDKIKMVTLTS